MAAAAGGGITIANGNGVAGNPTFSAVDNSVSNEGILYVSSTTPNQGKLLTNTPGAAVDIIAGTGLTKTYTTGNSTAGGGSITLSLAEAANPSIGLAYLDTEQTITTEDSVNFEVVSIQSGNISVPTGKDYFLVSTSGYYELNINCNIWRTSANNTVGKFLIYNNSINTYPNVELDLNDTEKKWISRSAIISCNPSDKIWIKCMPTYAVKIDQAVITLKKL
jgi:hypothetical protein